MGIFLAFIVTVVGLVLSVCDAKDTCVQQSNDPCTQSCTKDDNTCPVMNCGKSINTCQQLCLKGSSCGLLQCSNSVKTCEQYCLNCPKETKLTCSSETCEQNCNGGDCTMECTDEVKTCKQICSKNTKCSLTCGKNTMCETYCTNATCVYKGKKPVVPPVISSSCSEEVCTKNCSGGCQETVLSCNNTKLCNLVCENGCDMYCGKTVNICNQLCRGNIPCHHFCASKSCKIKKADSVSLAADKFHNHIVFLFIISATCLLFINN